MAVFSGELDLLWRVLLDLVLRAVVTLPAAATSPRGRRYQTAFRSAELSGPASIATKIADRGLRERTARIPPALLNSARSSHWPGQPAKPGPAL